MSDENESQLAQSLKNAVELIQTDCVVNPFASIDNFIVENMHEMYEELKRSDDCMFKLFGSGFSTKLHSVDSMEYLIESFKKSIDEELDELERNDVE